MVLPKTSLAKSTIKKRTAPKSGVFLCLTTYSSNVKLCSRRKEEMEMEKLTKKSLCESFFKKLEETEFETQEQLSSFIDGAVAILGDYLCVELVAHTGLLMDKNIQAMHNEMQYLSFIKNSVLKKKEYGEDDILVYTTKTKKRLLVGHIKTDTYKSFGEAKFMPNENVFFGQHCLNALKTYMKNLDKINNG